MKRCLVTGGAGFMGANIVRKLLAAGHNIHIITEKNPDLWRLHDIESKISIHKIDLREHDKIATVVTTFKPEWIFHLASFGGFPNQAEQKLTYDVNFYGTINLVNACKKAGFECFINTGSSSEYGIKNSAMSEDSVLEPISDYAVSKAAATQFCLKEAVTHKLPIYTVRPFSVYGDFEVGSRLIPSLITNALRNMTIELSWPQYVRDFIYIQDIVDIYLRIAMQKPDGFYVFNAGTGMQSTIQEVFNTVQKVLGTQLLVKWGAKEPRFSEPKNWLANIEIADAVLAWQPGHTLEQGLTKSTDWFKNNLNLYPVKDHHVANPQIQSSAHFTISH